MCLRGSRYQQKHIKQLVDLHIVNVRRVNALRKPGAKRETNDEASEKAVAKDNSSTVILIR